MTDNIKYHSYNNYKDIEIWYGDRDKGKFIISTVSEYEADTVVNELNRLLSENIRLEKENKELQEQVQEQEQRKWACLKEAHRLDLENEELKTMNTFLDDENSQINNELKTRTALQHRLKEENEQLKEELKELKNKAKDDAIDGLQLMMAHYNLEDLE